MQARVLLNMMLFFLNYVVFCLFVTVLQDLKNGMALLLIVWVTLTVGTGFFLKEQCHEANILKKLAIFFQFRWSAIRVNHPHAFPSLFDFEFVGQSRLRYSNPLGDYFKLFFSLKLVLKLRLV